MIVPDLTSASFSIMVEVDLADEPELPAPWMPGPARFPRNISGERVDFDATHRLRYFAPRIGPLLYPAGGRFWRAISLPSETGDPLRGIVEILVEPFPVAGERSCVLVLHAPSRSLQLDGLRQECSDARAALTRWASGNLPTVEWTGRQLELLFVAAPAGNDADDVAVRVGTGTARRELTRAAADEVAARMRNTGHLTDVGSAGRLLVERRIVVLVASGGDREHVDPFDRWTEGEAAAPDRMFTELAQQWLHTIYSDCGLIATLQRSGLNRIADRFASLATEQPRISQMMELEHSFARFKSTVWWRQVTEADEGNRIVGTLQTLHALDALRDDVGRDLAHYSEQLQTLSAARSTAAVTVLTLVLFPLTVLVEWVSVSVPDSWSPLPVGVAFFLTVPAALILGFAIASVIPGYLRFLRDVFGAFSRRG